MLLILNKTSLFYVSTISAVDMLCVTQQGCDPDLISCSPVGWISLLSPEIPLAQISSCAGTIPVSFPAIICMTFCLFWQEKSWFQLNTIGFGTVLPNAHKFRNCYFRVFLFHWNKWLLLPKCLKGSSFIVSLSDFYVQLHEELFHVFCRVNFGSSVILLHGSMVEGVWLSSYDKIWHVFHKYKQ